MAYTLKRLNECTLDEAVQVWNEGFTGYYVDLSMTLERFHIRMLQEGLSPKLSFIAYMNGIPVGIVLNGIRVIQGRNVSWNGGTGISPEYRGMGIGKWMIDQALTIYREEGVELATLEAIRANERAIRLYLSKGYEIADEMTHMTYEASLPALLEAVATHSPYTYRHAAPHELRDYENVMPWQLQWANYRWDGEVMFAYDQKDRECAYALYRRIFDRNGRLAGISVGQCRLISESESKDNSLLLRSLLARVLQPEMDGCRRTIMVRGTEAFLMEELSKLGFKPGASQVYMSRAMEGSI
ncbi:GNAT family N-acetyltransferase [Paenibacillus soyae]|uniref:GNAT family N-acetyltransferase n=1 Tax=Paenibacillus soyae TaxID=2969249 RepID=A0A9X2MR76_9BACL|nr:GNAT family N-acetyltransferase [Paenibacillus soyae]MCR2805344.1 GNAT family N-acetyltransferase [Paenibacillus soyae]